MQEGSEVEKMQRGLSYEAAKTKQAVCMFVHVPTCMAPRFSVSCSGLDVPKRTELTPSFLRHHAGERKRG